MSRPCLVQLVATQVLGLIRTLSLGRKTTAVQLKAERQFAQSLIGIRGTLIGKVNLTYLTNDPTCNYLTPQEAQNRIMSPGKQDKALKLGGAGQPHVNEDPASGECPRLRGPSMY